MACVFHLAKLAKRLALIGWAALAAGACGDELTDPPSAGSLVPAAASLVLTPSVGSGAVGSSLRFTATLNDSAGHELPTPSIAWESFDPAVATVDRAGLVRALAPGTARIAATSGPLGDTATVTVTPSPTALSGYYVAADGTASGDGSRARPWDLATALAGANGRIVAGDQIWLRGGIYPGVFRTALAGQPTRPIVIRQFPGERATIDGGLRVDGPDVIYWGFEIMQSNPLANGTTPALLIYGARTKYINLVIHDAAQQGITFWDGADDAEVYGCLVYNNGLNENKDHGIYVHNSTGTKLIEDNVFFNNLAYGIHAYAGPEDDYQRNIHVIGNVSFNNGSISALWTERVNLLIGAEVWGTGMRAIDNMLYFSGSVGQNMWIGYTAASGDVEVRGNTVWGGATALTVGDWEAATVRDNTVGGSGVVVALNGPEPSRLTWSGNRYYRAPTAAAWSFAGVPVPLASWQQATGLATGEVAQATTPSTPQVVVRPNRYEPGRAHVVVYNWGGQSQVNVSVSQVLTVGQRYEVRNVQDPYGAPVARGTYTGGALSLPMGGVAPPPRLGRSTRTPPRTGPSFDAFVITVTL
jgi:parallel beta-helix repeat protein